MVSEKSRALFELLKVFENINITASILTNLMLIYLIIYRSSKEIGAYKYLLLAFAANDIYFPIVHVLTLPCICSYKDAFIMFSLGILTSSTASCMFASSFSQTMTLLAHLFVYRLVAIKWPHYLQFYTAKNCFLLVAVTLAVDAPAWFFNCHFNYASTQMMRDYVQPFLIKEEFKEAEWNFIGALYWNSDGEFVLRSFLATMGFNSMMMVSSTVIVFCWASIVSHFRREIQPLAKIKCNMYRSIHVEWSGATKKMQQQLFRTLVVQMIIPMVFVYFPCAFIINLPIFGFHISVFPNLVSAAVTLFPLIDAWIIIVGVTSYRNAIIVTRHCKPKPVNPMITITRATITIKSTLKTEDHLVMM